MTVSGIDLPRQPLWSASASAMVIVRPLSLVPVPPVMTVGVVPTEAPPQSESELVVVNQSGLQVGLASQKSCSSSTLRVRETTCAPSVSATAVTSTGVGTSSRCPRR